jgi:hypothetical protein
MLDTETKSFEASPSRNRVISWSESGKAFRIFDVPEFANSILPRYFRTKKFSSFQRNLNLVRSTPLKHLIHENWNFLLTSVLLSDARSTALPKFVEGVTPTCTPIHHSRETNLMPCSSSVR